MSDISSVGGPNGPDPKQQANPTPANNQEAPGTGSQKPFFKDMPFSHKEKMEFLNNMMRFFSTQIAHYKQEMHDAEQRLKKSEKGEI